MTDHTVASYDKELAELSQSILRMGGIAENMLTEVMDALVYMDMSRAKDVVARDLSLDSLQRHVEEFAVLTIARRQPMAIDLREIVAAFRISADLERVGDLAKNIGKRAQLLDDVRIARATAGLKHMSDIALLQLKNVLSAYANRDLAMARAVWDRDAELDDLESSVFRDLLTYMMEDPRNITFCTHMLFCSKNIERVGDHATNIAETVHYLITGESLPTERRKYTNP